MRSALPGEFDLPDRGGQVGGLDLEGRQVVPRCRLVGPDGDPEAGVLDAPLGQLVPRRLVVGRPGQRERGVPGQEVGPAARHGRRRVVALEGDGPPIAPRVVPHRPRDQQAGRRRQPGSAPLQEAPAEPLEPLAIVRRAIRFRVTLLEGPGAAGQAGQVVGGEVPEPFEQFEVARLQLLGQPAERPFQPQRVQLRGRAAPLAGAPAVGADGEDCAPGRMPGQRVGRHPVLRLDQPADLARRRAAVGQDAVVLRDQQGDGAVGRGVVGALDVALQQALDLLLTPPPVGRRGGAVGVEAEEYGVAVGEEGVDRPVLGPERDVLPLVILDDQVEPPRPVVQPQLQLGLGQRAGRRLAGLDLRDLLGQVLGAGRVGRRQADPGDPPGRRLAIEHRQQRRLPHRPVAEQRDPLRPGQPAFQRVEVGFATIRHDSPSIPRDPRTPTRLVPAGETDRTPSTRRKLRRQL